MEREEREEGSNKQLYTSLNSKGLTTNDATIVTARQGHASWLYNSFVYIHAGRIPGTGRGRSYVDDLWRLNIAKQEPDTTPRWEPVQLATTQKPQHRHNQSVVVYNDSAYIFGGSGYSGYFDDLWKLDLNSHEWTLIKPNNSSPPSRHGHSAVLYKNKMWVFGGKRSPEDKLLFYNEILCFDFATNLWETVSMDSSLGIPAPRCWQSCDVVGSWMIIYGGFYMKGKKEFYFDDTWICDLEAKKWRQVEIKGKGKPHMRNRTISAVVGSKDAALAMKQVYFWIQGGNYFDSKTRKDEFFSDSWLLSLTWKEEGSSVVGEWRKTEGKLQKDVADMSRGHHSLVLAKDGKKGYIFGGERKRVRFNDLVLVQFYPDPTENRTISAVVGSKDAALAMKQVYFWIQGGNYFDSKTRKDEFFSDSWLLSLTWKEEGRHMLHRLCRPPSIHLSFNLAAVLPRRIT
eukprot:TRINITY_DN3258_c0_g1_i1.p1 TRINITY_DN3258_c0_g1~~TRINITY_DN3258_c0_g1_i1.p1  ORF type:complete len:457 (-),score=68.39 TRINITY_DN3258_c0_g1_i1:24-1394(-)